ncbi:MAG: hypothetical protein GZ088_14955 [Acidipila sp.]|nr:hypothetical protein [Acidipila sp.]
MAELHESTLVSFRKKFLKKGFQEKKSPMPDYRPDVFAQRVSKRGAVKDEIIAEAEIESTLFKDHTSEQLAKMEKYLDHRKRDHVIVKAYLVVPTGKRIGALAQSLLDSLTTKKIRVVQL